MSDQYKELVELLLPAGLLSYFDLNLVTKTTDSWFHIHMKEHNAPSEEFKGRLLHSKELFYL